MSRLPAVQARTCTRIRAWLGRGFRTGPRLTRSEARHHHLAIGREHAQPAFEHGDLARPDLETRRGHERDVTPVEHANRWPIGCELDRDLGPGIIAQLSSNSIWPLLTTAPAISSTQKPMVTHGCRALLRANFDGERKDNMATLLVLAQISGAPSQAPT